MTDTSSKQSPRYTNLLLGVLIGAAISMGGWSLLMTVDHEARISVIESNHFTDAEAERMKADIMGAIQEVHECLLNHQAQQPCD